MAALPRRRAGGLDAASYGSWYAALVDLSLRLGGLGWRNALCETAFVARGGEGVPSDGDLDALAVRWPAWHARLARFLMEDPLHAVRAELAQRLAAVDTPMPQRDLFADLPGIASEDADDADAEDPADPGTQALPHVRGEEPIGE